LRVTKKKKKEDKVRFFILIHKRKKAKKLFCVDLLTRCDSVLELVYLSKWTREKNAVL